MENTVPRCIWHSVFGTVATNVTIEERKTSAGFFIDQVITASRPGGAVRYPSGKIQKYTISLVGYPQQNKVYVLFLKRDEVGDYSIFTGYEVNGSVVQPLDGQRNLPKNEPDLQFGIYRGVSLESFRNALQKAIQQGGVTPNENTSQTHSQPLPHHRSVNASIFATRCGCSGSLRNTARST